MIDNEWPNTGTKINFIIMGLLTILFFVPSFAQDNDGDIEEVIVKGNVLYLDQVNALKTPVEVINVPQTVSIFTDEDIRKQGFRAIGDIIRYTPGVNTSQGEGHRDAVVFRGVRSTADFYQDGVRDDVQYYRSLYNVEHGIPRTKCSFIWPWRHRRYLKQGYKEGCCRRSF